MAAGRRRRARRSPVTIGLIALAIVLVAVFLGFTKDIPFTHGFRVDAVFESANSLRLNSPVRIAGVEVGKVKAVEPKEGTDQALVTLEIKDSGLPIHEDATAKIRPRIFLEGNFFVDLQPGTPSSPDARDGDTIKVTRTATPVQLDQVLTSLQSDTRQDLRDLLDGLGKALSSEPTRGRRRRRRPVDARRDRGGVVQRRLQGLRRRPLRGGAQVNEALLGTEPERDVSRLLEGTARTTGALVRNESQLKDLITNFNTTMAALASESDEPAQLDPPAGADARERQRRARLAQPGVPADAGVRARDPARRPRDGGDDRRLVPVDRARRASCSRRRELRGLAQDLAPTRDEPRAGDRRLAAAAARRSTTPHAARRDVVLPTGDIVDPRRVHDRRRELQGVLVGDGRARRREPELRRQRLLRALPARRRRATPSRSAPHSPPSGSCRVALGARAASLGVQAEGHPGKRPPVQLERPLPQEHDPRRQRAVPARGAARARGRREDRDPQALARLRRDHRPDRHLGWPSRSTSSPTSA